MAKQKRDAEATKAKILTSAIALFSKNGFDATTADDIAKESQVNKALIYYYFKNKAGLYETVMSSLFNSIYEEVIKAEKCCDSITSELHAFIETYANYAQKHPYFPALLLRELSDSGAHLPEMMFASMRRLFLLLSDILRRGEAEGVFKKSIPMVLHFMIIGSLNLLVTTQPLRKQAAQMDSEVDTCSECPMDEIAEYIFNTVKAALEVN
ncbi:TetR/AcrR family transcriptional regulator [Sulfurimonas autotrophica]|uniref:Transcriptional regulator, TetR family n=1 Tax=Sulfurimonas autotrophica (strain ATCC BAA-671 / DSM 16294 / JCM 11897 / OK10) TaxID=563040 RepID=E0UUX4_SULAO|nr:TetR family transcriptional regulator [Sulfurimonas autotrophica]ADN08486.1 transcriptional regulator, TetR family [Sulfurimonas autotrophica DSM 16294]